MSNKYTTSIKVLEELPGAIPEDLTDDKIEGYIEDASRYIDARLPNYAGFPDIGGTPSTPALIEKIARLIAARDCMIFMGEIRGEKAPSEDLMVLAEKMIDDLCPANGSSPRAMLSPDEYDYSQTPNKETARLTDSSRPHSIYRADLSRDASGSGDVEDS